MLIEKLFHAFNFWIVKVAQKENIHFSWYWLLLQDDSFLIVVDVLLSLRRGTNVICEGNINEWNNSGFKLVLRSFYNYYELLAHSWTNFESNLLLKLLWNWVFNEPAIEINFCVDNACTINIGERKLFSIVLAENLITIKRFLFRNLHSNNLILFTNVAQKQSWTKNFSANKLAIIDDIWVNIKNISNEFAFRWRLLESLFRLQQRFGLFFKHRFHIVSFRKLFRVLFWWIHISCRNTRFWRFMIGLLNVFLVLEIFLFFKIFHPLEWRKFAAGFLRLLRFLDWEVLWNVFIFLSCWRTLILYRSFLCSGANIAWFWVLCWRDIFISVPWLFIWWLGRRLLKLLSGWLLLKFGICKILHDFILFKFHPVEKFINKHLFFFFALLLREFERQFFSLFSDESIEVHEGLLKGWCFLFYKRLLLGFFFKAWFATCDLSEFKLESTAWAVFISEVDPLKVVLTWWQIYSDLFTLVGASIELLLVEVNASKHWRWHSFIILITTWIFIFEVKNPNFKINFYLDSL